MIKLLAPLVSLALLAQAPTPMPPHPGPQMFRPPLGNDVPEPKPGDAIAYLGKRAIRYRDFTAWLKLVETRFNLPSLTKRDAAQMDMTEFFDFVNVPWKVPPSPPTQPTNGQCYLDRLP